jgi:competence protein ComEC
MGDPAAAALVNSLLFGDRDPDNEQLWSVERDWFSRTGLYHVLVVDGAKVGLLFVLLSTWRRWALRPQREARRRRWRLVRAAGGYTHLQALVFGLLLLAFYVPLVGLQPPIVRAALVAAVLSLARFLDRETDPENSLAAAALILLVANPLTLYDLGFQFSFVGVWGMIRGTAPLERALSSCVQSLAGRASDPELSPATASQRLLGLILKVTAFLFAAQLATAPLQAYYFQTVSLIGPLANPPVVILSTVLIPIGFVSSLMAAFLTCLSGGQVWAQCINWPTEQLARLMNGMVAAFARPTWGTVSVLPPSWWEIALYRLLGHRPRHPGELPAPRASTPDRPDGAHSPARRPYLGPGRAARSAAGV